MPSAMYRMKKSLSLEAEMAWYRASPERMLEEVVETLGSVGTVG